MPAGDVVQRKTREPPALQRRDRLGWLSERVPLPRLDLDKHHRLTLTRDDVNFSTPAAVSPGNNGVAALLQLRAGEILAGFSERHPGSRHVVRRSKPRSVLELERVDRNDSYLCVLGVLGVEFTPATKNSSPLYRVCRSTSPSA